MPFFVTKSASNVSASHCSICTGRREEYQYQGGVSGAIIGVGDRKSGVHEVTSKKPNVLFLEQNAPPSTSQTRAGTPKFAGISGDGRPSCDFI